MDRMTEASWFWSGWESGQRDVLAQNFLEAERGSWETLGTILRESSIIQRWA